MNLPVWAWLALALLLLALILALVAAGVLWRRTRRLKTPPPAPPLAVAQLQKPMFAAAMAALYPRDADLRYDKPCVLVCGAAACGGADLLRGAGLEPVVGLPGKDSGWWRGSEGVAFDLPVAAWEARAHCWTDFLRLLDRHRGRRALDAIVWHIALDALERDGGAADGERMYRKLVDIQDRLGLRLPVYVVVTACDKVEGFGRWAARLPETARAQALGWSNPNTLGTAWRSADGEQGVARLLNRLRRLVSALSTRRDLGADAAAIFVMPDRLGAALSRLPLALQEAMRENAVMTPCDLRGLYVSGRAMARADAGGAARADPFGPAAAPAPAEAPAFCRELFAHRVFGEFGLAKIVQRRLDAEKRAQLIVLSGACLLAALWLVGLAPTYFATRAQLHDVEQPLLGMKDSILAARDAGAGIDEVKMKELLIEMDKVPDWNTATLALPASWHPYLGGLRWEGNRALKTYYEQVLFHAIDRSLKERAALLTGSKPAGAGQQDGLAPNPEGVAQFDTLDKFVNAARAYEYQRSKFKDVTAQHHGSWKEIAGLLDYLFDMKLNDASPTTVARFDGLLQESSYRGAQDEADLDKENAAFRTQLARLHQAFLDGVFARNRLFELQAELVAGIKALDEERAGEQRQLAQLQKNISDLRHLLTRTDAAWMIDGQLVNGEAYRKLEAGIRKSRMLERLADELHAKALARQTAFRSDVVNDSSAFPLLDYSEGKHLQVNADLGALEQALGKLLLRRFAQGAPGVPVGGPDGRAPLTWDVEHLAAARDVLADLQAYEAKELTEAPPSYQATLRKLARLQAGALIERELALAANPAPCEAGWNCANFDDARKWIAPLLTTLRQLEMGAPAQRWQRLMDTQALSLLKQLNMAAERGGLYLPDPATVAAWDGTRASAPAGYGMRAAGDTREYLDRQLQAVGDLAAASKGPRAWLTQSATPVSREAQALLTDWNRVEEELAKQAAKVPTGSLARLEKWFADELPKLEVADCAERLPPAGAAQPDFFQRRMANLAAMFGSRCFKLEMVEARRSYGAIAAHFNRHLWNRYPFAAARDAAPAEPDHVRRLLQLLDANKRIAGATLKRQRDPASMAALAFVERLSAVQPILAAMLADDPAGGYAALDLWPQFRVNRGREKGGEQIFEWTVAVNGVPSGPEGGAALPWRMEDKIELGLRWAKNSGLAPAADPARPEMRVAGAMAGWRYDDAWALLHALSDHAAPLSDLPERDARAPVVLRFKVPTRDANGASAGDAVVYARLAVSVHGKPERLAVPPFPTGAAPPLPGAGAALAADASADADANANANANDYGEMR